MQNAFHAASIFLRIERRKRRRGGRKGEVGEGGGGVNVSAGSDLFAGPCGKKCSWLGVCHCCDHIGKVRKGNFSSKLQSGFPLVVFFFFF